VIKARAMCDSFYDQFYDQQIQARQEPGRIDKDGAVFGSPGGRQISLTLKNRLNPRLASGVQYGSTGIGNGALSQPAGSRRWKFRTLHSPRR
jgi:hypothetical protein